MSCRNRDSARSGSTPSRSAVGAAAQNHFALAREVARGASGRALHLGHLLAQRLTARHQREELAVEIAQCGTQLVQIHRHVRFDAHAGPFSHAVPFTERAPLPQVRRRGYHAPMSSSTPAPWTETLPEPLPADPLDLASQWLAQARIDAAQPNPNAMVLATADDKGQPSARVVLCKDIVPRTGHIVFYTNYQSRKGRDLRKNPRAAIVFHWDYRHRQVRAEGRVEPLDGCGERRLFPHPALAEPHRRLGEPPERAHRLASRSWARASPSPRTASASTMADRAAGSPENVSVEIPRPPYWGGFRLEVEAIELWVEGEFRIHDRARWTRDRSGPAAPQSGPRWSVTRLQP